MMYAKVIANVRGEKFEDRYMRFNVNSKMEDFASGSYVFVEQVGSVYAVIRKWHKQHSFIVPKSALNMNVPQNCTDYAIVNGHILPVDFTKEELYNVLTATRKSRRAIA